MATGKLTDKAIEGLHREAKQAANALFFWDEAQKGLGVRVSPQGQVSWLYRYFIGTKSKRLTFAALNAEDAKVQASGFRVKVSQGVDLLQEKDQLHRSLRAKMQGHTVDQALELYLEQMTATERYKNCVVRSVFRTFSAEWGKGRVLATISKQEVKDALAAKRQEGKLGRVKVMDAVMRAFFKWAVQEEYLEASPMANLAVVPSRPPRERALTPDEIRMFWRATYQMHGYWPYILRLLLLTGQREAEVTGMQWTEINQQEAIWTIPGSRTKNKRTHVVPLSPQVVVELSKVAKHPRHQYLFSAEREGKAPAPITFGHPVRERIRELCGFKEEWTIHDLRRTFSTQVNDKGLADPHIVEACLNHISGHQSNVAGVYNKARYVTQKREAFNAWGTWVEGIVNKG